ncbi:MAG: hypothetical protein ACJA09_002437 [Alcanivorax sp.]|jgi:hypothetical protein
MQTVATKTLREERSMDFGQNFTHCTRVTSGESGKSDE